MRINLKRLCAIALIAVICLSIVPILPAHAEAPDDYPYITIEKEAAYLQDIASQDVTIPLYRLYESGEVGYCLSYDLVFNPYDENYRRIYPFEAYSWDDYESKIDTKTYSYIYSILNRGYPKEIANSWPSSAVFSLDYFQSNLTEEQREYGTAIAIVCALNGGMSYFIAQFQQSGEDIHLYVKCLLEDAPSYIEVEIYEHEGVRYDFSVPQTLSPVFGLRVVGSVKVNLSGGFTRFYIDTSKLPEGTIITTHDNQSTPITPGWYNGSDGDVLCIMLPASQFGKGFDYQRVFYSTTGDTSFFWYESDEYGYEPSKHPIVAVCADMESGDDYGERVFAGIEGSDGMPEVSYILRLTDAWYDTPISVNGAQYSISQDGNPIGFTKTGDGEYTYPGSEMVVETHDGEIHLFNLPQSVHVYPGSTDVIAPYTVTAVTPPTGYALKDGTFSFDVRYYDNSFAPMEHTPHFGQVKLTKQGETSDILLEGAVFGVFNASTNVKVGELRTSADGTATSVDEPTGGYYPLITGDYYLKELMPPTRLVGYTTYRYALSTDVIPFTITSNGQVVEITSTNELMSPSTGVIILDKRDYTNREPLDNAVYGVYREWDDEFMCEITTSSDGKGASIPLEHGTVYYLKEIKPPEGFILDDTTTHRVNVYTYSSSTIHNVTAYNKHIETYPIADNPTVDIEKYVAYLKDNLGQDFSIPLYRLDSGDVTYCLDEDAFNPGGDGYNAFDPLEPSRFDNEETHYALYNELVKVLMLGYPKDEGVSTTYTDNLTDEEREYGTALAIWSCLKGGVDYFKGRFPKPQPVYSIELGRFDYSGPILHDYVVYLLTAARPTEFNYNNNNEAFITIKYEANFPNFFGRPFHVLSHAGIDYIAASFIIYLNGVDRVYMDEDRLPPGTLIHAWGGDVEQETGTYMLKPSEFVGYNDVHVTLYLPYSYYGQHIDLTNFIYGYTYEQSFYWYEPDDPSLQTVVSVRKGSRVDTGDRVYASLLGDTEGTIDGFTIQKRDAWRTGVSWDDGYGYTYELPRFSVSQDGTALGFTEVAGGEYHYPGDETVLTTSSKGILTVSGLPATFEHLTPIASPYVLTEVGVPHGFDPIDPMEFDFNIYVSNGTTTIYNTPQYGQVKLIKQGETSDVLLEGAVYGIYEVAFDRKVGELTTGSDGTALSITEKTGSYYPLRLRNYYLKELTPPEGYALNTTQYPFTIDEKGEIVEVVCTNTLIPPLTGVVELLKRVADTHDPLESAVFGVYKTSDDTKVGEITTASNGEGTSEPLAYGEYYVKEITAPEGYVLDDATIYPVTINADNTNVSVTADNEPIPTATVTIIKVDANNADTTLGGAVFGVYSADDDSLVEELTTDADGTITSSLLLLGEYYIKEISAPNGYVLDETKRPFTLSDADENVVITITNSRTPTPPTPPTPPTIVTPYTPTGGHLRIIKRDANTGRPLSGAMFAIYRTNGEFVAELTTDGDGYATSPFLDSGDYYISERVAPLGYNPITDRFPFSITDNGVTRELTIHNTPSGMGTVIFEYRHVDDGRELDRSVSYTDVIGTEYIPWAVQNGHDKKPISPYYFVKVDYPAQIRIIDGVLVVTYWYDDDVNGGGSGDGVIGSDGTGGGTYSSIRANEVPGGTIHAIPKTGEMVPSLRYGMGLTFGGIAFACIGIILLRRSSKRGKLYS